MFGLKNWRFNDCFPQKITEISKMQKYKCSENNSEWFILQFHHFSVIPPHHCMFVSSLMWSTFSVVMLLEISEYYFICVPVSLTLSWWWWWCNQPPELSEALHIRLLTTSIHRLSARSLARSQPNKANVIIKLSLRGSCVCSHSHLCKKLFPHANKQNLIKIVYTEIATTNVCS